MLITQKDGMCVFFSVIAFFLIILVFVSTILVWCLSVFYTFSTQNLGPPTIIALTISKRYQTGIYTFV